MPKAAQARDQLSKGKQTGTRVCTNLRARHTVLRGRDMGERGSGGILFLHCVQRLFMTLKGWAQMGSVSGMTLIRRPHPQYQARYGANTIYACNSHESNSSPNRREHCEDSKTLFWALSMVQGVNHPCRQVVVTILHFIRIDPSQRPSRLTPCFPLTTRPSRNIAEFGDTQSANRLVRSMLHVVVSLGGNTASEKMDH